MRLWSLSDLHVNYTANREAIAALPAHPGDWLVLAGDISESEDQLAWVFSTLTPRFAQVIWVPGNHELYTIGAGARGVARYEMLVDLARRHGVLTPEDPWPRWPDDPKLVVCPLFLLYDYTFAPDGVAPDEAVVWAAQSGIHCADERYLHPDPHPDRGAWCRARVEDALARLDALPEDTRTILINHWPLRRDLVRLFRIPRFVPWCGTRQTEDWHRRFRAELVISGHLHMRATDWRDGVRFEEVSLGYPRHWKQEKGIAHYLRMVWPTEEDPPAPDYGPHWRF